jgi:CheY-like chemotaxis protein
MSRPASSRRILVIDDQPEIHADFRKILVAGISQGESELARLRAAVKGAAGPAGGRGPAGGFMVDSALQGEEGFKKIVAAREDEQPYSVAFIDMRMPPGWDGLRTMNTVWEADPDLQMVVCTAYSDHPWSEIDALADKSDRVLVLKKPFDAIEVKRMAATLSAKWRITREAAVRRAELEGLLAQRDTTLSDQQQRDQRRIAELETMLRDMAGQVREISGMASGKKPEAAEGPVAEPGTRYSLDGR